MKNSVWPAIRLPLSLLNCCLVLLVASSNVVLAQDRGSSTDPRILLFRILPATIEGEQWHEFHWEVLNTGSVKLTKDSQGIPGRTQLSDGSIGWPLSMSGSFRMKLTRLTTFELVATNRAGKSVRKMFTVKGPFAQSPTKPPGKVPDDLTMPKITSFRVSPATIEPGGWIKFYWQVEDEASIRLYEDAHEVDLSGMDARKAGEVGAFSTTIDETTTFRLEVIGLSRQAISKTFTVQVTGSAEPTGTCVIRGQLQGKWRRVVQEQSTGPASTWTVEVYAYTAGSERPAASASVDNRGIYRFEGLEAGTVYKVRPSWRSSPRQGSVSCDSGKTRKGPRFTISNGPLID